MENEPRVAEMTIRVRMVHVPVENLFLVASKANLGFGREEHDELDAKIRQVCSEATNGVSDNACGFIDATVTSTEQDEDFVQSAFGLIASIMQYWTTHERAIEKMVSLVDRVTKLGIESVSDQRGAARLLEEYLLDEREHNKRHGQDSKFVYVEKERS